jgi:hypothetical protein
MNTKTEQLAKTNTRKIPNNLIREKLRGKSLYYKDYKDVLSGNKQIEEIMGNGSLQSILVMILGFFIKCRLDKKYYLATNEAGLHLGHRNNLSTDLGIFLKEKVVLNDQYFKIAPEIAIEIDVKIETDRDLDYIFAKSEEMMKFGTQQILWIITKHKKVFIIAQNQNTQIVNWDDDILLMSEPNQTPIIINIKQLLEEEEIEY